MGLLLLLLLLLFLLLLLLLLLSLLLLLLLLLLLFLLLSVFLAVYFVPRFSACRICFAPSAACTRSECLRILLANTEDVERLALLDQRLRSFPQWKLYSSDLCADSYGLCMHVAFSPHVIGFLRCLLIRPCATLDMPKGCRKRVCTLAQESGANTRCPTLRVRLFSTLQKLILGCGPTRKLFPSE